MKKRYIALTLILSLLCINKTYANTCKLDVIREFEEISNRYTVSYRYNLEKKSYTLILDHSTNDNYSYKIYEVDNLECEDINKTTKECHNFQPGTYKIAVKGKNDECSDIVVKVLEIEIKEYHNYSDDPICEGIEEFVLCQEDYYKDIDYETFVSRANTYKQTKQEKLEEEKIKNENEEKNTTLTKISKYITENIIQIIIIIIFIVLVAISTVLGIRAARKSRRLE